MSEITDLHIPFRQWLETMPVVYRRSRPDMPTSEMPGEPDFTIFRGGFSLHIEFKTKDGKVSANQKKRHAQYAAVGATVHVTNDIQVAITLVTQWLETLSRWGVDEPKAKRTVAPLMIGGIECVPDGRGGYNVPGAIIRRGE